MMTFEDAISDCGIIAILRKQKVDPAYEYVPDLHAQAGV